MRGSIIVCACFTSILFLFAAAVVVVLYLNKTLTTVTRLQTLSESRARIYTSFHRLTEIGQIQFMINIFFIRKAFQVKTEGRNNPPICKVSSEENELANIRVMGSCQYPVC